MKLPSELKPEDLVAIIDTREQLELDLSPLQVERSTLETGDYSIKGLEHVVRVERKSLDDLLSCIGRERSRFDREIQRLLSFPVRVLVIEASWSDLESGLWLRSRITPEQVIGSLLGWQAAGVSIHCVGDHDRAGKHVARLLYTVARRRYRELRTMFATTNKEIESTL
jgi:DNA excision repair protein ERCC-4